MNTISDKFENGKLSGRESDFVFAVKSFWENNIIKEEEAVNAESETEFDMEQE